MSELKPCPWCGGPSLLRGAEAFGYFVSCETSGCYGFNNAKWSRADAIETYNRRTPQPVTPAASDAITRYTHKVEGTYLSWRVFPDPHADGEWCKFSQVRQVLLGLELAKPVTPAGGEVEPENGPLPRPLWDHEKEWYTLCERAPHADSIKISGQLAEAIIEAVCRAPIKTTPADLNAEYARGRADGWEAHPPVADAALDDARFEWLGRQMRSCTTYMDGSLAFDAASFAMRKHNLRGRTIREAIDAAMQDAALNQRGGG